MNYIYSLRFSHLTLLILMSLPFLYFIVHFKYWYDFNKLQSFDFFLRAVCIIIAAIIIVKGVRVLPNASNDEILLIILHIIPIIFTFLTISYQKRVLNIVANYTAGASPDRSRDNAPLPTPVNAAIERLTWDDIIIGNDLKAELISVAHLLRDPKETQKYGIDLPKGILFTGPPGTGKTTIAKVMANEAGMNFFVLSTDEIVSKWVGESEKNLTRLFNAAKKHAPAIIFIDEVDSIGRGRSSSNEQWADNLLNHLLQLIDGVVKTRGLYIIAATNRAELVDDALKRAGRLNKVIEIPLPDFEARIQLFALYLQKLPLEDKVDLPALAHFTEGKSGADIKAICQQAGLNAFKREAGSKKKTHTVIIQDIESALREFMQQHR